LDLLTYHLLVILFWLRWGDDDEAGNRINLALLKRGIIVRPVGNYGLPQWLRISIGLPEENAAFLEALKDILAQQ
jgi:histidinol-phosphate aminotransferase